MINIIDSTNSALNKFVAQLRDENTQKDSLRFRENLKRCGYVLAYEISKALPYKSYTITTPLGEAEMALPSEKIVIATILRAGLPMHQGMLEFFDDAENAFVSAYRHWSKDGTMKIVIENVSTPDLEGKILIIADPMLATGHSIEMAYDALVAKGGQPAHTHFASVIASTEGIEYVKKHLPNQNITVWSAAQDSEMTVKNYIVPGIGDPGDLAFGKKL